MNKPYIHQSTRKLLNTIKSIEGVYLCYGSDSGYWLNSEAAKVPTRVRKISQLKALERKGYIKLKYGNVTNLSRVYIKIIEENE